MMKPRCLTDAQRITLLARAPLIFYWAEQATFARDALEKFIYAKGWNIARFAYNFIAMPVFWELALRSEWYARYLNHLMHQLDEPIGGVEEFRHPKFMQDVVDNDDITTGRCTFGRMKLLT